MDLDITTRDLSELHKDLWLYIVLAAGMIIVGVFAIIVPFAATIAVEWLAGVAFAVGGIIMVIHAFRWKAMERLILSLLLGLIYFAFGIFLMAYPFSGMVALTISLGVFFLAAGVFKLISAFRMRPSSVWGWALLSGIVSVLLSFLILGGMPLTAFWAIGLIVGIDLIFAGLSLLMIMLAVRRAIDSKEAFCIGGDCYSF